MRKIAFVFPGQGSQYVGMGKDLFDNIPDARKIFETADSKLGVKLSEICFNGPEETLKLTINTQPAILTTSIAVLKQLEKEGLKPDYVAGHSLGEYTALVAAGALSFEDAVWLVRQRGAYMQEAVPPGEGTMAAVIGLDEERVKALCSEASSEGVVEPANYNSPGQIVIAGAAAGITKAISLAKDFGAKRAIQLPVSGPFHSSLLQPASEKLQKALQQITIKDAEIPVLANYTARIEMNSADIEKNLINQVSGAVLWQQSIEEMIELGVETFVEIGPGKVLSGLIKKIDKSVEIFNIENIDGIKETYPKIKGVA